MKSIVKRNLPLDVTYSVIDKKYIPVADGFGCTCDNCGKLIANIATIKSINGTYQIGFDCLETFLLNNSLLENFNGENLSETKKMISQIIRFAKKLKEVSENHNAKAINKITGIRFEKTFSFDSDWLSFYWQVQNGREQNDSIKIKGMNLQFLTTTLQAIFPKLKIYSNK